MTNKQRKLRAGVFIGSAMVLIGVLGLVVTIVLIAGAFAGITTSGIGDPGSVSKPIGETLIPTFVGIGIAAPGVVLLITCLMLQIRERKSTALDQRPGES